MHTSPFGHGYAILISSVVLSGSAGACATGNPVSDDLADFELKTDGGGPTMSIVASQGDSRGANDSGLAAQGEACVATQPQSEPCGKCGTHSRECLRAAGGNRVWGEWSQCSGELSDPSACDPSIRFADEACGNCGTRPRICGADCRFVTGTTCVEPTFNGEPACAPGSADFVSTPACSSANSGRYRSCDSGCRWSAPGPCETLQVGAAPLVSVGLDTTCSLRPSGHVACWGFILGVPPVMGPTPTTMQPTEVVGLSGAVGVATGAGFACALLGNGAPVCWGNNGGGVLGVPQGTLALSSTPVTVAQVANATAVSAGWSSACALIAGGTIRCWGDNYFGELGNGSLTSIPGDVQGITTATAVSVGSAHACAIVAGGTVRCWGANLDGELGVTGVQQSPIPVPVAGVSGATSIASGHEHTCAIVAGGAVACWGDNYYGQLGRPPSSSPGAPALVPGVSGATALAAGDWHACAILAGGVVKCWGSNVSGELGDGSRIDSFAPVQAINVASATSISAGSGTCAQFANGGVTCWGGVSGYQNVMPSPFAIANLP